MLKDLKELNWLKSPDVKPYVFIRKENFKNRPGSHFNLDWFPDEPLYKNPLEMNEVTFANQIYELEGKAFGKANMAMPRWVFYDCAILPGFVAGFAAKSKWIKQNIMKSDDPESWIPLSLFICIPTMSENEWVAHNLCSVNSFLPPHQKLYGLGFLTKAFGMWYANVQNCIGITQWGSPALKLHSHYGDFEILTAYTPIHSYANTLTYRLRVDPDSWIHFFTKKEDLRFLKKYRNAGFVADPNNIETLKSFQKRLENGNGPYFLRAHDVQHKALTDILDIYQLNS